MANIAKKILSTFLEVSDDDKPPPDKSASPQTDYAESAKYAPPPAEQSAKFTAYFDKLFKDANLPGPDYFEFAKMIEAMNSIPDERSRYSAAFAGLNVQGLDKPKLLSTASEYLRILIKDAENFDSTVDATLQEKVHGKQKEISEKTTRIEQLSKEMDELRLQISRLNAEIKENEEKIQSNSGGYKAASADMRSRIEGDIEKIKQHIH